MVSSAAALPGDLALTWMDRFGDNLYSTYGSTEVAWASIADPEDLREAPSSAGRLPHATVVRILDEKGPDHSKCFKVCVEVGSRRFEASWGQSKKLAEQQAALNALRELGMIDDNGGAVRVVQNGANGGTAESK